MPLFFNLARDQQPTNELTSGSEASLLSDIQRGARMVAQRHVAESLASTTSGDLRVWVSDLTEPEDYYDAIADILQAANHMGLNAEALCEAALNQQEGLMEEAQEQANRLRSPGSHKSRP